ncbi:uncharacterized protein LOC132302766 isoform X1 [Cornus florida]|uniref:uncharacterized protein LOC132302766 isoform X1 n=1 Tax=Cornus florida TaxID=4283 RepID=UPI0028992F81|nr:uncharacterized protein LOC132302766 isoform X1 [Cornus florida]
MCGIALIVSGIRIDLSSVVPDFTPPTPQSEQLLLCVDDIEAALWRRGPDSLGRQKVFLCSKLSSSALERDILCLIEGEGDTQRGLHHYTETFDCISSANGVPSEIVNDYYISKSVSELHFIGATLQLRGISPITQPLADTHGNILVYNGEIFGGIHVSSDSNDTEILMQSLAQCCLCNSHQHTRTCKSSGKGQNSVPELLSMIKGPWALIYWQGSSRTVWFGRDALGRRSLLVHWPTSEDSRLLLSSVSSPSSRDTSSDFGDEGGSSELNFWEELSCGVYSISMGASGMDGYLAGEVKKHQWTDPMLRELIKWERTSIEPNPEELRISRIKISGPMQGSILLPSQRVLIALRESVIRRTTLNTIFEAVTSDNRQDGRVPVAVLFSGGLDSMILAALLNECLDPIYEIDLLNVSFDGQSAPDRISARAGVKELKRIAPLRRWKLVEIDAELSKLPLETKHVMSLINPAKTYMDLNIGIALWLAAGGDGWVYEGIGSDGYEECQRVQYKSESKILLVGSGADEQCAGYGRHKTKYRHGSWLVLHEEMKLDMQRIWKRNLGRDDRCIADNGKEARFPFLDEDVIRVLLDIPLWEIADLDQPSGIGDKKILREVAKLLGIIEAAILPKRAIQFGSRIARESNRKNFGSNRAANQASAGSAVIYRPPS